MIIFLVGDKFLLMTKKYNHRIEEYINYIITHNNDSYVETSDEVPDDIVSGLNTNNSDNYY